MSLNNGMRLVAELMAISARTAPKGGGHDCLGVKVLNEDEKLSLAEAMVSYGVESKKINFDRDAENVRKSDAVLLISVDQNKSLGLNCGACGCETCSEIEGKEGPEFFGPICAWRLIDLGIALGSAAKTASMLNADNRIMYRIGVVARKIGLSKGSIVVGIPISAYSKNIYFDR